MSSSLKFPKAVVCLLFILFLIPYFLFCAVCYARTEKQGTIGIMIPVLGIVFSGMTTSGRKSEPRGKFHELCVLHSVP